MMKKIAVLAGAGALVLSLAVPALARPHHSMSGDLNVANVDNATTAVANTGVSAGNVATIYEAGVGGEVRVDGTNVVKQLSTGEANALAVGVVVANTQIGCSTCGRHGSSSTKNIADVGNATVADAETGAAAGSGVSVERAHTGQVEVGGTNVVKQLHTGDANSDSYGVVVVNTRWTGFH